MRDLTKEKIPDTIWLLFCNGDFQAAFLHKEHALEAMETDKQLCKKLSFTVQPGTLHKGKRYS